MARLFIVAFILCIPYIGMNAQVRIDRGYDVPQADKSQRDDSFSLKPTVKLGLKAGVLCSDLYNDMPFNPDFKAGIGYMAGAVLNLHWGQRTGNEPGTGWFGIQPEVLYAHNEIRSVGGNLKFNNIQMPIMFKLYPLSRFSIELGPEFSYMFYASPSFVNFDVAEVSLGDYRGLHIGAGAGVEYEFGFGLTCGARYSMGFTDIAQNLNWKTKNVIQVSVGWLF